MSFEVPQTAAQAERLRQFRAEFQAGADYVRDNHPPPDIDPDIWSAVAEACEAMVDELDDALGQFARGVSIP